MRIFHLFAIILTLAAPLSAQEADGPITTEASASQDAQIAVRIREILQELGNYSDVTVAVADGVVTLRGTANSTLEATDLAPLAGRIEGVVAVKNQVTETTDISRRLSPAVDRFNARLEQTITFLPLAIIAAAAFALVAFVGFALARLRQPWDRLAPNAFIADLFRQLVRIAFIIGGIVIALDIMNATALLSTILGAAGIIGLAIGFAVRDTVENFIASVMLSIRQPFRPNDTVEINGDQGKVIRLTSRATILLSFDGNHIRIPNATVFNSRIINYSQNAERRFMFNIRIDREVDLHESRALIAQTVGALPFVLPEPSNQVWIEALEGGSVQMVVTGWIDQNVTSMVLAKGEAIQQVKLALDAAGVTIPDSTQRITLTRPTPVLVKRTPPPAPELETVAATSDDALTRIVDAERSEKTTEDLLGEKGQKE